MPQKPNNRKSGGRKLPPNERMEVSGSPPFARVMAAVDRCAVMLPRCITGYSLTYPPE